MIKGETIFFIISNHRPEISDFRVLMPNSGLRHDKDRGETNEYEQGKPYSKITDQHMSPM